MSPDSIKNEVCGKFSPVYQHDCHEFFTYIISNLQDEETPLIDKSSINSSGKTGGEESWNKYDSTHPSIIDKLFSGNYSYLNF